MNIHPTALVSDRAELHPSVKVGPYSIIEAGVRIDEGCVIESHARIFERVSLGAHNTICHGATIGAAPQDLTYTPDKAKPLIIGDHNTFKENVVISLGVKTDTGSRIGDHNYLMNAAHIGHDCIVGNHNIMASNAVLGGHVEMDDYVFISGSVAVHQFCKIGSYAMLSGVSGVAQDVPPYVMTSGNRAQFVGLNRVGLKRNGFNAEQRNTIKRAYQILLQSGLTRKNALHQLQALPASDELDTIIRFVESSDRGIISAAR